MTNTQRWLRDRADSYWSDSVTLLDDGDMPMSVAYRAIADELRKCAAEIATQTDDNEASA